MICQHFPRAITLKGCDWKARTESFSKEGLGIPKSSKGCFLEKCITLNPILKGLRFRDQGLGFFGLP